MGSTLRLDLAFGENGMKRIVFPIVALGLLSSSSRTTADCGARARRHAGHAARRRRQGAGATDLQQVPALGLIVNGFGYTRGDWDKVVGSMVALPQPDRDVVLVYLADAFSREEPAEVDHRSWQSAGVVQGMGRAVAGIAAARSAGDRRRRHLVDRAVGERARARGPEDRRPEEFPLKTLAPARTGLPLTRTATSGTGNSKGLVGKLNPKTGEVTEYPMPDPAARDPHTPLFDKNGLLWFTLQQANMVGTLEPRTGAIKLITMPTPRSLPYGMVFSTKASRSSCCSAPTRWRASIRRRWP